jgi:hypothetical protein
MSGLPFQFTGAPAGGASLSVGFPYTGAPRATNSLPGLAGVPVDTTVRPNSVIGLNSFVSVANHFVTVNNLNESSSEQDCRNLGLGMLVFVRETQSVGVKNSRKMKGRYGLDMGNNTVELKELTQLNAYLEKNSDDYENAHEVVAEWRLMGVIKSEAAPTSVAFGSAGKSRILNLVVSHRVSVLNYWLNHQICQTQKLYLIVNRNSKGKWHIKPWSSPNCDYPRLMDIMQTGSDKRDSFGAVIYVGKSSDQVYAQNSKDQNLNTDFSEFFVKRGLMNQLEIYLGV